MPNDREGHLIQSHGLQAAVHSADAAVIALMREDSAHSDVAKPQTELDAFGCVN